MLAGFLGIKNPDSVGVTVPLLATQLLWINLLTDAAPALAMGVDPTTEDVMNRKPRKLTDRVIDGAMWGDIVYIGLIMAIVTLIAWLECIGLAAIVLVASEIRKIFLRMRATH